jgi:hypothetical protein
VSRAPPAAAGISDVVEDGCDTGVCPMPLGPFRYGVRVARLCSVCSAPASGASVHGLASCNMAHCCTSLEIVISKVVCTCMQLEHSYLSA